MTDAKPSPTRPGWRVVGQTMQTLPGPGSGLTTGWRVTYETAQGVQGSVFVPQNEYTPDRVKELISEAVATVNQIHQLSG